MGSSPTTGTTKRPHTCRRQVWGLFNKALAFYRINRGDGMAKFSMTKQKFINQWLRHFASGLSKEQFEIYIKDQYIWHVFSFNLIAFDGLLVGDAARKAFNQAEKSDCICCDMFDGSGVTDVLSSHYDSAEKIDEQLKEFYVVSKDYSWTYIKTHEGDLCGPYFWKAEDSIGITKIEKRKELQ